jgi:hypothetical protein
MLHDVIVSANNEMSSHRMQAFTLKLRTHSIKLLLLSSARIPHSLTAASPIAPAAWNLAFGMSLKEKQVFSDLMAE